MFKDTRRGKAPSNNAPALAKNLNMDIYIIGTSNQLFITGFQKSSSYWQNFRFLWSVHFVFPVLFVLTLTCDMTVLYWNNAFSTLSTNKKYSSFLKKVFVFQKICFKFSVIDCVKIWKRSDGAKLLFQWIIVLNWVKHSFSLSIVNLFAFDVVKKNEQEKSILMYYKHRFLLFKELNTFILNEFLFGYVTFLFSIKRISRFYENANKT